MRNEVVALEDKSYSVISVYVPVSVGIRFRASAVDYKISVGILIKTADNVKKRRFSAARRTENRDEFASSERD